MAKRLTRLNDFFDGKRRGCRLVDLHPLKDRVDMMRLKLDVSMPLSNMQANGINPCFADPYYLMAKTKSQSNHNKVAVEVHGAHFKIFLTPDAEQEALVGSPAMMRNFRLIAEGSDDKRTVDLHFDLYVPVTDADDDGMKNWSFKHLHKEFWLEAVPSQMKIEDDKPDPKDPKPNKKKNPKQASLLVN